MAIIGTYYLIEPKDWLFATHGDVQEAKRRAELWFSAHGTYDGAEQEIEEFVRQWALKQLLEVYQYPIEWLGEKIQIEEPVKMGSTEKEADIALYKVVEKLQAYSFVDSNADIKGRAFQGVLSSAIRAGMGQYFTPDPIVDLAVRIVQPKPSDLILDPFCGSGHFLSKSLDFVTQK